MSRITSGSVRMHINSYQFGKIIIEGQSYYKDVIVLPDRIIHPWWRDQGHLLQIKNLESNLEDIHAELLVVGTGQFGIMKLDPAFVKWCDRLNMRLISSKTGSAVKAFNQNTALSENVVGAFHLTC